MKKVLIIEDDTDIVEALQIVLSEEGYDVAITTKGDEVYKKIATYKPDVIILDLLLSGNDGSVICKSLKADAKTTTIPVIMISAHPGAEKAVKECGADGYIPKPFSVDTITAAVRKFT